LRPPSLKGGYRLGKTTFAEMGGKEEDAPFAVIGKREGVCALSREDRFKSRPAILVPGD
jgi:hypothetical protein